MAWPRILRQFHLDERDLFKILSQIYIVCDCDDLRLLPTRLFSHRLNSKPAGLLQTSVQVRSSDFEQF